MLFIVSDSTGFWVQHGPHTSAWFQLVAQIIDIPMTFRGNVSHRYQHGPSHTKYHRHCQDYWVANWTTDNNMASGGSTGHTHQPGFLWQHRSWTSSCTLGINGARKQQGSWTPACALAVAWLTDTNIASRGSTGHGELSKKKCPIQKMELSLS